MGIRLSKFCRSKLKEHCVKNMKLNLGYPEVINEPGTLDSIFGNLEFGENHLENVLQLRRFKTRYFFNRLWYGDSDNPISQISLKTNPFGDNARYDYTKNTVYLNLGLLRSPIYFYSEDIPKYLRFGEISFLVRQMSHAFDTTGCFYDGKGKMWDRIWWPETLVRKYDFYTDCLRTQLLNKTSIDVNNNETLNTIVGDIGSFLVSYDSYCESGTITTKENKINSPRFRVNTAVSNMKDFGEVFNCPSQSPLNPSVKCNLL
ncbi:hypothetical protein JTE90_014628 [Oedothorax gibbosus]|uniref:Peptidase M13 C-terminal domain-containing protein n=1 Tax=Oedothorax gibbosus TaxID=931172 RepID=A0AAV6VB18_9ARAC|nr:hypothetical protein JTE90_014628 [Oedothorax gibbosus]